MSHLFKGKGRLSSYQKCKLTQKRRNVLHGNGDRDRYRVRRDSESSDLAVIRMVISIGIMLAFRLGTADVKGAYIQRDLAKGNIVLRPTREYKLQGKIWKLLQLPYGIVEAERQWICAIEDCMLATYNMERLQGAYQLFIHLLPHSTIEVLVAKVVDDFLLSETDGEIQKNFS